MFSYKEYAFSAIFSNSMFSSSENSNTRLPGLVCAQPAIALGIMLRLLERSKVQRTIHVPHLKALLRRSLPAAVAGNLESPVADSH